MNCIYKNKIGKAGELAAKHFLIRKNLNYIKSNYRFERAEIDLIFSDEEKKTLIFTEVKTRTSKAFGDPLEAITSVKQAQIKKAAMGFVSENEAYSGYEIRLDVITVMKSGNKTEIRHYPNAF
ncbi:MAG: hypothetical protein HGGPFJEG_01744 [Ignavibacteria bacterium]|nr:hypothetical protein [Ignavibacteria bacterium]